MVPRSLAASVAALTLILGAAACGDDGSSEVVATVGDTKITKAEYDELAKTQPRASDLSFDSSEVAKLKAAGKAKDMPLDANITVTDIDPPAYTKCMAQVRHIMELEAQLPAEDGGSGEKKPKPTTAGLKTKCRELDAEIRKSVMTTLIDGTWVRQAAAARGIELSENEKASIEDGPGRYAEETRKLTGKLEKRAPKPTAQSISAAKIADYYKTYKDTRFNELEKRDVDTAIAATKGDAKRMKRELERGSSYDEVIARGSDEPLKWRRGGRWNDVTVEKPGEPGKTIMAAKLNELTGPIHSDDDGGWYVFQVVNIDPATTRPFDDEVKGEIRNSLLPNEEAVARADFIRAIQARARRETKCAPGYVVALCGNAPVEKDGSTSAGG